MAGKQSTGGRQNRKNTPEKLVGVLNLQGGVREHLNMLNQLKNIQAHKIKDPRKLRKFDALIIPGGESTTIGKLIQDSNFVDPILNFHELHKPIWGTCAGAILLAKNIFSTSKTKKTKWEKYQFQLGLLNITIQRNGYGSQLDSFICRKKIPAFSNQPLELVFVRAPKITATGANVKELARVEDSIVAAEKDNLLVTTFHPELTDNPAVHRYFVNKINSRQ